MQLLKGTCKNPDHEYVQSKYPDPTPEMFYLSRSAGHPQEFCREGIRKSRCRKWWQNNYQNGVRIPRPSNAMSLSQVGWTIERTEAFHLPWAPWPPDERAKRARDEDVSQVNRLGYFPLNYGLTLPDGTIPFHFPDAALRLTYTDNGVTATVVHWPLDGTLMSKTHPDAPAILALLQREEFSGATTDAYFHERLGAAEEPFIPTDDADRWLAETSADALDSMADV